MSPAAAQHVFLCVRTLQERMNMSCLFPPAFTPRLPSLCSHQRGGLRGWLLRVQFEGVSKKTH